MTRYELLARYEAAINGEENLQAVVAEIDQCIFDGAAFSGSLFDRLLQSLQSPLLLKHRNALVVMKLFEDQAEFLESDQAAKLVGVLPEFVDTVHDDIAAFLAIELWVSLSASKQMVLKELTNYELHCRPSRLMILVHGFDWLCKITSDNSVRKACITHLSRFQRHADPTVAAEANAAIARRT